MRRGFTLIEMMVVTTILALMASMVVPRLVSSQATQRTMRDVQTLESFLSDARRLAISGKQTYTVTYDDTTNTLTASPPEDTGSAIIGNQTDSQPAEKKLLSKWTVSDVVNPLDQSTTNEFSVRFFGDGTSEDRTATFSENGAQFGIRIAKDGSVLVQRGALAAQDASEWEAGNLEQKQ